jgi:hypothetical protein
MAEQVNFSDQIKKAMAESTAVLDTYGDKFAPVKEAAAKIGVNSGLLVASGFGIIALIVLAIHGW